MGLPRTFVGFSSTDMHWYRLMLAWKQNEHIYFDFTNCQLQNEINSNDEAYIKRLCHQRIKMSGKYILLIGEDTRNKYKYVRWEAQVAIELNCTIIGVNLDMSRHATDKCPQVIRNIGAMFVPFSLKIVAYALEHYGLHENDDYHYKPNVYQKLGYD